MSVSAIAWFATAAIVLGLCGAWTWRVWRDVKLVARTIDRIAPALLEPDRRSGRHETEGRNRAVTFRVSMSGKGNCHDNSAVETFFKTIRAELIWRQSWPTRRAVEITIFNYINGFCNPRRHHSALGWKSPVAFEKKMA